VTFPDIRKHNLDTLAQTVYSQDWSEFTTETNVDTAYSLFIQRLSNLVQSNIPFRHITVTDNTPSYITPLVRSLLCKRNKLMHRGKSQAAGELSTKIGHLVAKHGEDELSNTGHKDTKKLWSKVQPALGIHRRATTLGSKYGSQFDDLDAINAHFASTATDPDYDINDINAVIESVHEDGQIIHPVSDYEIYKLLSSIKKCAPGSDNIPYWVFKHCAVQLTCVVANLINTMLQTGQPPSAWKSALVTPIPNSATVKSFGDLRPISVTPILSRVVEKLIVQKFIVPALPHQFAYWPTGSTTAALISLTHNVAQKLESCNYVRCLQTDYTKAFDMINHPTLFRKLKSLSIPPQIQRWIFKFFTGRKQAVISGGQQSQWLPITRSVVQGSGIGPSAYLVYSMDLKTLSPYNTLCSIKNIRFDYLLYLC